MGQCSSAFLPNKSIQIAGNTPKSISSSPIRFAISEKEEQLQDARATKVDETIPYEKMSGFSKLDQQIIESSRLPPIEQKIITVLVGERSIPMCKMRTSYSPVATEVGRSDDNDS